MAMRPMTSSHPSGDARVSETSPRASCALSTCVEVVQVGHKVAKPASYRGVKRRRFGAPPAAKPYRGAFVRPKEKRYSLISLTPPA